MSKNFFSISDAHDLIMGIKWFDAKIRNYYYGKF